MVLQVRTPPTPEDTEIFRRNIRRVFEWDRLMHVANCDHDPRGSNFIKSLRNATCDYLHYTPVQKQR